MTMHIVRGLTSVSARKRRQTVTKKHKELLMSVNTDRANSKLPLLSSLQAEKRQAKDFTPLKLNYGPRRTGAFAYRSLESKADTEFVAEVRSVMDPRNLEKESPETRAAILEKSQRIAPAFSKGAYQLITEGMDLSDLGKKK